ncbi:MAG: type I-E CRISPR-associated protein Cas5/CasD [Planctomycetes bacterium]|nr:type I-E CRISPR-associated protein Cas5/CasD [Planctomycetota bacterium]
MSTLLLRLAGPMQSWGTQSRFSVRDTGLEPSKSGVIGLLCAALGRRRSEPVADLTELAMGVRVNREGTMKRDYHTALNVAKAGGGIKVCEPSNRYYLADADFLVGFEGEDERFLGRLDGALRRPRWQPYLGRKSFVPSIPTAIEIVDEPMEQALRTHPWFARTQREYEAELRQCEEGNPRRLRLVFDAEFGSTHEVRPDILTSFAERDFATLRYIRTDWLELTPAMIKEDPLCISAS